MAKALTDLTNGGRGKKKDWRWVFLDVLALSACVTSACFAAKVSRETAYCHRKRFPKFARKWTEALEISVDLLEFEARRRAFAGPQDRDSARLLALLLSAHKPEKYRESRTAASGLEVKTLSEIVTEAELANDRFKPERPPPGTDQSM